LSNALPLLLSVVLLSLRLPNSHHPLPLLMELMLAVAVSSWLRWCEC
jgi:hypothetical protein